MNNKHCMVLLVFAILMGTFLALSWPLIRHLNHRHGRSVNAVQADIRVSAPILAANGITVLILTVAIARAVRPWKPLTWRTRPGRIGAVAAAYLSCAFAIPVLAAAVTTYIPQLTGRPPLDVSQDIYTFIFCRIPPLGIGGMLLLAIGAWFGKDRRAFRAIRKQCQELGIDETGVCEDCGYILTTATCPECGHTNPRFHPKSTKRTEAPSTKRRGQGEGERART